MKQILILLLLPSVALAKDCKRELATCDRRINEQELNAAIQTKAPAAKLHYQVCQGDISINGVLQPNTSKPAYIEVEGVPEGVQCSQVWQFLLHHNPTETTQEEGQRKHLERLDSRLQQLPSYQNLLSRIEALEAQ